VLKLVTVEMLVAKACPSMAIKTTMTKAAGA